MSYSRNNKVTHKRGSDMLYNIKNNTRKKPACTNCVNYKGMMVHIVHSGEEVAKVDVMFMQL